MMKDTIRKGLLSIVTSSLLLIGSNVYSAAGDVQGRDLDYPIINGVGHIGLEHYDAKLYEMLTKKRVSDWGYRHSGLFNHSVSSFKDTSPYWGAKYWKGFESPQYNWRLHDYILPNTKLMYEIGADYTAFARHRHGSGTTTTYSDGSVIRTPHPGKYRCDSLVNSMYITAGLIIADDAYSGILLPLTVYNAMPNKR